MRILVMGHKGMLGSDLMAVLGRDHEVSGVDVGEFDITSAPNCHRVIGEFNPAVVVNAAAYTDVDGCETNRDACFAVNAEGVLNVALACRDRGAKVVHYSTDYVFDGTKMEPYLEDDPCRPINAYGASKRKGEERLIETVESHVLIRTAWLYGRQGKNFVKAILAKARDEGVLRVVDDQVGSPTYARDLCRPLWELAKSKYFGTYHVTNSGQCSWFDLAVEIVRLTGANCEVAPIDTATAARKAPRPAYSVLENREFKRRFGKELRPWQEALKSHITGRITKDE